MNGLICHSSLAPGNILRASSAIDLEKVDSGAVGVSTVGLGFVGINSSALMPFVLTPFSQGCWVLFDETS